MMSGDREGMGMGLRRLGALSGAVALTAGLLVGASTTASAGFEPRVGDCMRVPLGTYYTGAAGSAYLTTCTGSDHNAQIYSIVRYPSNLPKPSALGNRLWSDVAPLCKLEVANRWLGAAKVSMPLRVERSFAVPSDDAWKIGEAYVRCFLGIPDAQGTPANFTGSLRTRFAQGPLSAWLNCLASAPKSGQWSTETPCGPRSKWLQIDDVVVQGRITSKYPRDLQAKADAVCQKSARPLLKKGSGAKAVAGLGPKADMGSGPAFAECFIPYREWNGAPR